ncbi:MAG: hypothetical protein M3Y74_20420 [Chloroflexota bacterium]|nr:hypothetical protein [Chloroflexota bacterium]
MPWRIPRARCLRCTREVRTSDLALIPAEWVLADEDAATLWPCGRADIPAGVTTCIDCREELHGFLQDWRSTGEKTCATHMVQRRSVSVEPTQLGWEVTVGYDSIAFRVLTHPAG